MTVQFHKRSICINSPKTQAVKYLSPSTSAYPVRTTPQTPHTHSITYHPHYNLYSLPGIFTFQYHSTNIQYPFIHPPHKIYNFYLSKQFKFPLSVLFHTPSKHIQTPVTNTILYFTKCTSNFPSQYHTTNAPNTFIHQPPTLCIISLTVHRFSLFSNISPTIHTHSFTYQQQCILFLSQNFWFPFSVSLHQRSIHIQSATTHTIYISTPSTYFPCQYHSTKALFPFIHLQPTLYNVSLPVLQVSAASTILPLLHTHSFN